MTELMKMNKIIVSPGTIQFNDYQNLLEQAKELSTKITSVEVNEENIKWSKKLLATVNKRIKELESDRIGIKKEILVPYSTFETQVKEIVSIVKEADNTVRDQIRTLEETDRDNKQKEITDLWYKRIHQYSFCSLFTESDFITTKHLNKTTTMRSIETEMVEWLEKREADFKLIDLSPNRDEVTAEYVQTKDLTQAMTIVAGRSDREKRVRESKPSSKTYATIYTIIIADEKDFKHAKLLLDQNDINYKTEKVDE